MTRPSPRDDDPLWLILYHHECGWYLVITTNTPYINRRCWATTIPSRQRYPFIIITKAKNITTDSICSLIRTTYCKRSRLPSANDNTYVLSNVIDMVTNVLLLPKIYIWELVSSTTWRSFSHPNLLAIINFPQLPNVLHGCVPPGTMCDLVCSTNRLQQQSQLPCILGNMMAKLTEP